MISSRLFSLFPLFHQSKRSCRGQNGDKKMKAKWQEIAFPFLSWDLSRDYMDRASPPSSICIFPSCKMYLSEFETKRSWVPVARNGFPTFCWKVFTGITWIGHLSTIINLAALEWYIQVTLYAFCNSQCEVKPGCKWNQIWAKQRSWGFTHCDSSCPHMSQLDVWLVMFKCKCNVLKHLNKSVKSISNA